MPSRNQEYELVARNSNEFDRPSDGFTAYEQHGATTFPILSRWNKFWRKSPHSYKELNASPFRRRRVYRRVCSCLALLPLLAAILVTLTMIFRPSYTYPPQHFTELRSRCMQLKEPGRGNVNNEKIFIAASLYEKEGSLVEGAWGKALEKLVELIGPANVYVSIYEDNADDITVAALRSLDERLQCNSSIGSEKLSYNELPHFKLPNGKERLKRITFLAEVRNRALRPLDESSQLPHFDKLLYLNDVIFDPIDAIQLLFSTNVDGEGHAQYRAACAVDFINPFKFYDTFATRDLEGYGMGVPFYPWFSDAGRGYSRRDVLDQKDAVRVRSCWSGMVAFDAGYFQPENSPHMNVEGGDAVTNLPVKFRSEENTFWDSSECCLIHADIQPLREHTGDSKPTGIYMNPYIRVAYDEYTLSWLPLTRRAERLYSPIHNFLNHMVGMPWFNARRTQEPGDNVSLKVWHNHDTNDDNSQGAFVDEARIATPGGFCGLRGVSVLNEHPKKGEPKWERLPAPADS
ncbi:glycosyltransferase family 69 protein [Patellaria atrata CBS 101060]|uniref:Glycosyltransferase family 69 protein n=1 Tax=Patellaria atrata CBS 101060 TaxID=1346257 RepID=A0A9P4S5U4_9PEZI|nr:glycosyltransferase family 69 protein [Patellaria atrata CBS 101060]